VRSPQPALEYLVTCSQSSLEGFELARLDQISKLRREIGEIQNEWIEAEVAARLARLLLESRRTEVQNPQEQLSIASKLPGLLGSNVATPQIAGVSLGEVFSESLFVHERSDPAQHSTRFAEQPAPFVARPESKSLPPASRPQGRATPPGFVTGSRSKTASTCSSMNSMSSPASRSRAPKRARLHYRSKASASSRFRFVSSELLIPTRYGWQTSGRHGLQLSLFVSPPATSPQLPIAIAKLSEPAIPANSFSVGTSKMLVPSSSHPTRPRTSRKISRPDFRSSQAHRSDTRVLCVLAKSHRTVV
jgi:hypothetical protein